MSKFYVCSAGPGCNQTFTKFTDFKRHEATHSIDGYFCTWPGCDFATMTKKSYGIHSAKHAGEQRWVCPHNGCDFKTHNPSILTGHRKKQHGYIPMVQGRGAPSATGSSSSQPLAQSHPPAQPLPPGTVYPYQLQLQPMQPQPMQPRPMQSHPTQYQPQPTQYQPPPPIHNQSLGVFYGQADTTDDYTVYTGPARAPNGWTEGCMCPESMQRRPSEMPGYEYRRH